MSDDVFKMPEARWEPGTLDNTRRNIGAIDKDEALRMTKILGGEIYTEKSVPLDTSNMPKRQHTYAHRSSSSSGSGSSQRQASSQPRQSSSGSSSSESKPSAPKTVTSSDNLPSLQPKVRQMMDRLMMSSEYKIKQDLGIFNFVRYIVNRPEKVSAAFAEFEIKQCISHLQLFTSTIKTLIQICPDSFKKKIVSSDEAKFRFFKTVGNWNLSDIKFYGQQIQEHPENVTISQMASFIKNVYKTTLTVFYLGDSNIIDYIKDVHQELCKYPKANVDKLTTICKQASTEWFYVYTGVIKKLYPILMRLCSNEYFEFPGFFTAKSSLILPYIGLTKYDVQMPRKKSAASIPTGDSAEDSEAEERMQAEKKAEEEKKKAEEEKKKEAERKKANDPSTPGAKTSVVDAGFKLLEKMFPQSGFNKLESMPDLYPYFEPLYDFEEGFNVVSPENAMQVTVVLLTILQDLFQGMRNVKFNLDSDKAEETTGQSKTKKDTLVSVLNEWSVYKENLFEKKYCDQMLHFVNQQYTQSDFKSSQLGKKIMTDILWQTRYNFLPFFEFEQLLLEKPQNDSPYRPLCIRTSYLRRIFTELSQRIDEAAATKGTVVGVENPWQKYRFDIPNAISKRMDILLGAKKPAETTNATNANLIKYALCVVSVLDWWINNKESPAYTTASSKKLYRISEEDGAPVFSVPLRKDQNRLFAASVKAAVERVQ